MAALNLSFLSSSSGTATGPDDFMNQPTDLGYRSAAGSATDNLHSDTGFILPRVKDVR